MPVLQHVEIYMCVYGKLLKALHTTRGQLLFQFCNLLLDLTLSPLSLQSKARSVQGSRSWLAQQPQHCYCSCHVHDR